VTPYYEADGITIYHADCREVLAYITPDVVVTDPPYGIGLNTDYRSVKGTSAWRQAKGRYVGKSYMPLVGDSSPFNPLPWLAWPIALFGINHYAHELPPGGTWHVWDKRDGLASNMFADCEFLWTSFESGPSRIFRHKWLGYMRASEVRSHLHPTQKPVALFTWLLGFTPPGVVLDPFMGSGPTLRAAKDLGRKAIGIEIEERYCEIAANRMAQGVLTLNTNNKETSK
jgi:DNA modification methylase